MFKTLTLVFGLAVAVGCKTDKPESSAAEKSEEIPSNAKPRSGKIDLPNLPKKNPAPSLPSAEVDDGEVVSEQSRAERRRQRMAHLDTDGDGTISEAEREAARAKREAEMKARLDTNKDGVVSDEERANARRQRAVDLHARFDQDGDGKLSQAELDASPFARFNTSADANGDGIVTVDELDASMRDRSTRPWGGGRRGGGRRGFGGGGSGDAPSE